MRWQYKAQTVYDHIKKRFAVFPVVVKDQWVWLESYYVYTEETYGGVAVARFFTLQEAREFVCSIFEN